MQQVARAQFYQHAVEPGVRALGRLQTQQIEQYAEVLDRMQPEQIQLGLELATNIGSVS